ncbi:hypothetical protein, partial [Neisseria gonorrhoeae]|uniref:hypothetical protein n=11 Tax=Neisseria gonorrhoeae TaxID=485 RepID=UPI0031F60DFA
ASSLYSTEYFVVCFLRLMPLSPCNLYLATHLRTNESEMEKYSELTKIRTRRRAAGSTNGTEPIRPALHHLRESFPLSRGGATPYRFLLIHYI